MIEQQTFTLAAVCQAAKLVQHLAQTGQVSAPELETLLTSITVTSPQQTLDVYGGDLQNLKLGFNTLVEQLGNHSAVKDPELTRYIVSMLALERRLIKKPKVLAQLSERIEQVNRQLAHYEITSETLIASFASIYSDLISPLGQRIKVTGEPEILKVSANQNKVRALLLAGIRSAVLWRQVGGKRRSIIFSRSKILECAQSMI